MRLKKVSTKILIVEDEIDIREWISEYLSEVGYDVMVAEDGQEGIDLFKLNEFDLVLLDIMLPKINGFGVLSQIREISDVPVMMLTAMTDDYSQIMSFNEKADDYITKPFNPLEDIARVKTQLRRYQKYNNPTKKQFFPKSEYDIRGLIINKDTHKCFLFGKEISLTPIEFSILWYLCEHQGKVVSTEELFENIWKEKYLDNNNTVMAHIGRLREKLNEPAKNPKFIKTVWGVGYEIE